MPQVPFAGHAGGVSPRLEEFGDRGFAVADDLDIPIKFVGTGEKVEDLAPFDPQSFVAALLAQD